MSTVQADALEITKSTNLQNWIALNEINGIKQHAPEWYKAKINSVGGSSIATFQGVNPYGTVLDIICEKIGLKKFITDIKPQWGNLFEDVIKRYVEHDKSTTVLGEDLYIEGPPGTAYSPDGLAIMEVITPNIYENITYVDTPNGPSQRIELKVEETKSLMTVLCEFKCPYSRIPSGSAPKYYVPQVKMGLDIIDLADIGMLAEGVFRRCNWEQLGNNPTYDKTLVPKSSGKLPLAYGILGLYFDEAKFRELCTADDNLLEYKELLFTKYDEQYMEKGDTTNEYLSNDLGDAEVELFKIIMHAYDKKILIPWYGSITFTGENANSVNKTMHTTNTIHDDLANLSKFCADSGYINFGILPWKLFRMDYNFIHKQKGFLAPYLPKIREILAVVAKCNDPMNAPIKLNIYNEYVNRSSSGGFSDD